VAPGSDVVGRLARRGHIPLGYYKDDAKTAATFVTAADGARWVVPGDSAMVEADGTITLLGRGSVCINTGGEKVFPEEVEEVLKTHPAVTDAVVVGIPDERFGEAIVALVELTDGDAVGGSAVETDMIGWVKSRLASFKAPKRVIPIATIGREANGKVDYRRLKAEAVALAAGG
jgi:acyl-CoA synthetase (AMP-forming)/AMP-acid ligase II